MFIVIHKYIDKINQSISSIMALNRKDFWVLSILFIILLMPQEQWCSDIDEDLEDVLLLGDAPNATCPQGYFQCEGFCFLQVFFCDGKADCTDYSDEYSCVYEDDNDKRYDIFKKSSHGIREDMMPGTCELPPVTDKCTCEGYDLYCTNQNLTSIPSDLPEESMLILDLTGNYFPRIEESFFDELPETDELVLAECEISFIGPNAFKRFSVVTIDKLHLWYNPIESFNQTLFNKRNRLRILSLAGNKIKELHDYDFKNLGRLHELDLRQNRIETLDAKVFEPLISLEVLNISHNRLTHVDSRMFPVMRSLDALDLSYNRIQRIERSSFKFPGMLFMHLSSNRLTALKPYTFWGMDTIVQLNISYNKLHRFELHTFDNLGKLQELILEGNEIKYIDKRVVQNLTRLRQISVEYDHLCQFLPAVKKCKFKQALKGVHLISSPIFRGYAWIITCITLLGNLLVFLHLLNQQAHNNSGHSMYLRHLAASGVIMGIYLAIIAFTDNRFRGEYNDHEDSWRHGSLCAFAGFLNTLSCQSSTLLLPIGAWDRMMVIIRPLQVRYTTRKTLFKQLSILWCVSFVLAATPLIPFEYFGTNYFGRNDFCLPLRITNPYDKGWQYSAMLILCVNMFALIFILLCYLRMRSARREAVAGPRRAPSPRENTRAKRFSIILGLDCGFWLPVILVKVVALSGASIGENIYMWLAFVIIPLSATLNPIIYGILTTIFKNLLGPVNPPVPHGIPLAERNNPHPEIDSSTSTSLTEQPTSSKKKGKNPAESPDGASDSE